MQIDYELIMERRKPILYLNGYRYFCNKTVTNRSGEKVAYFYCANIQGKGIPCTAKVKCLILDVNGTLKYIPSFQGGGGSDSNIHAAESFL